MAIVYQKTKGLTDAELHYCPGCHHGIIHKLVAEVLEEMGLLDDAIGVCPVGCSVFAYKYFNCDMQEAAHGRAPAVATGIKRTHPTQPVFTYQGDGDLASIGAAEIVHAAMRGEKFTTIFVNNAIYGMTGGQMAPTTLIGQKATTCPLGRTVEQAGMAEGLNVTWSPSYGPEMRGGTANCSVVLSDKPVGSPVFAHPTELIALNEPSLEKFEAGVVSGGQVFINSDVVTDKVSRSDLTAYYIPCNTIADEIGNPKVSNMVMLGAYVAGTGILKPETIEQMIQEMFTGAKAKFVPLNIEAFRRGCQCVG